MRGSRHFGAVGLAVGAIMVGAEPTCPPSWVFSLEFNSTNVASLVPCLSFNYACPSRELNSTTYVGHVDKQYNSTTGPAPANCIHNDWYISIQNGTNGSISLPGVVSVKDVQILGPWCDVQLDPECVADPPLNITNVDLPDLAATERLYVSRVYSLQSINVPKLKHSGSLDMKFGGPSPPIHLSFPSLNDSRSIYLRGNIDAIILPVLNYTESVNITSTGNLDCAALVASVFNATRPGDNAGRNNTIFCKSLTASIATFRPWPTKTSDSSRLCVMRASIVLGFVGTLGLVW